MFTLGRRCKKREDTDYGPAGTAGVGSPSCAVEGTTHNGTVPPNRSAKLPLSSFAFSIAEPALLDHEMATNSTVDEVHSEGRAHDQSVYMPSSTSDDPPRHSGKDEGSQFVE